MKQALTRFFVLLLLFWTSIQTQAQALNFDGINDHVTLPNTLATAMTASGVNRLTIEYWFKGSKAQSVIRIDDGTNYSIRTGYDSLGIIMKHVLSTQQSGGIRMGTSINDGNWHHVAFTWYRLSKFTSYLDGNIIDEYNSKNAALKAMTSSLFMGSRAGTAEFLSGTIDELRIWTTTRTQAEIQANMNKELAGNETGLMAYYKFNEGVIGSNNSGITQIIDATTNARHGTLVNFAKSGSSSNWVEGAIGMKNTWTGATSSNWSTTSNWSLGIVPRTTDSIVFATTVTNQPTLPANSTVASITLSGTNKISLGDNDLTVTNLTGASETSYIVTDGAGSINLDVTANEVKTIPVGSSTSSYDPVTVQPTSATRFKVKVKAKTSRTDFTYPIAIFAKVAPRQWDITPTTAPGSTVISLKNGGTTYRPTKAKIGHYKASLSKWEELAATRLDDTWTTTTADFSPFGVGEEGGFDPDVVLSTELLSFKGTPSVSGNLLTWTTANELNNKGFQIERVPPAPRGGEVWDILGFVNTKGKSSTYDFLDVAPPSGAGGAYYRLRQFDNDGKETLSKVISVSSKGSDKLKTYPNPVTNVLTITTNTEGSDFEIFNLLGQQVMTGKTPTSGAGQLDVSALPQGTYVLKVGVEQVKFIKHE